MALAIASIDECIDTMVKPGVLIEPDPAATAPMKTCIAYQACPVLKQIREQAK